MPLSRRSFLYYTGPLTIAPFFAEECSFEEYVNEGSPFLHGVASGDPLHSAVVIWTRVTADASAPPAFRVDWVVAKDATFGHVVAEGTTETTASVDYTVKVDVTGLKPDTTYYYRFRALGHDSPIGRTRTFPRGAAKRARFAVVSCSNYPYGFFNAYRSIAERADLNAVLHLGDYLYEYGNGGYGDGTALGRVPDPTHEIVTLEDYRRRHALYKTDPDLAEAHRQHPFIVVWDDHESANDAFLSGAENHQPESEGSWEARRRAAIQAYFEWMPIRAERHDDDGNIYRSFHFGDLADLVMLDTRLAGRDQQAGACDAAAIHDPNRQLLGAAQEAWFFEELEQSQRRSTRWRLVGQQVMFAQLVNVLSEGPCIFNPDQWDGYGASRARVLEALARSGIGDVVFLTGDIHSSWGNDIAANPFDPALYNPSTGAGSVAVEIVTPGVTSPGIEDPSEAAQLTALLGLTHPHVRFVDLSRRGYVLLDVTREKVQAEWYHVETIIQRSSSVTLAATLATAHGQNHLVPAASPSSPVTHAPALAPELGERA